MREIYIAFHIVSESSDHYLFCEKVEFSEDGMEDLLSTLIRGSDMPISVDFCESESLTVQETQMLRQVISGLYEHDWS